MAIALFRLRFEGRSIRKAHRPSADRLAPRHGNGKHSTEYVFGDGYQDKYLY
jgi:hypothetical protein